AVTVDGIINSFKDEQGADIAALYPRDSICISDYDSSLRHDTRLLRESPGTPPHADIYGYVYDIDTGALAQVVSDVAKPATNWAPPQRKQPGLRSGWGVAARRGCAPSVKPGAAPDAARRFGFREFVAHPRRTVLMGVIVSRQGPCSPHANFRGRTRKVAAL